MAIDRTNAKVANCVSSLPVPRLPFLLLLCLLLNASHARAYDVLCRNGDTHFEAQYHTGVAVNIGPPTQGTLAARRVCRAVLSWGGQETVVAAEASEVDLDMFGVDLGDGVPVAAFQVKRSEDPCCMTYLIYSLDKPPRLLRTLHGGHYFNGADTYLDGRVEIWTDDAAAIDGFEGMRASRLQYPPTIVLRFEDNQLLDVSSEFQPFFDQVISNIRRQMDPHEVQAFTLGGGRSAAPIKAQVLELVWAYLYSDRAKEAWKTLAEMWPAADLNRIRAAILRARARGLRAQLDGTSHAFPPMEQEHVRIYDSIKNPARPIMVRYYPPPGSEALGGKLRVKLVVDSAGKVWSMKVSGKNKAAYVFVKRSASNWKFIPAFMDDQSVASHVHMTISLAQ